MAKKIKLDNDIDDLDDLPDDLDFMSMDDPERPDDRHPVTKIISSATQSLTNKDTAIKVSSIIARAALPAGYSMAFDEAVSLKDEAADIYDKTIDELKPAIKALKNVTAKSLPFTSKFLPKKIAAKLKQFSTEEDEDDNRRSSQVENDNSDITNTLKIIFGAQRIENELRDKAAGYTNQTNNIIGKKQFLKTAAVNNAIASGISRLVGYQDTVLNDYYKKSLELQYRSFFNSRDLLDHTKATTIDMLKHMDSIAKNTALPNEVKVNNSEMFKHASVNKLIGAIQEPLGRRLKELPAKILKAGGQELVKAGRHFVDFEQMTGMGDQSTMAGEMLGDHIASTIGDRLGEGARNKLHGVINRIRPDAGQNVDNVGHRLRAEVTNIGGKINRKMKDADYDSFWGFLRQALGDNSGVHEKVNHNLKDEAMHAVPWDMISRRTLIEVIPGFMSRSLEQLTNIYGFISGRNETTERQVYSSARETFVNHSTAKKDVVRKLRANISVSVKHNVQEIVDFIDMPVGTLTAKQRMGLSMALVKESTDEVDYDPTKFADSMYLMQSGFLDADDARAVAERFEAAYGITRTGYYDGRGNDIRKMSATSAHSEVFANHSTRFADIRGGVRGFGKEINQNYEAGEADILKDIGLLKRDTGEVDNEYYLKVIRDLLETPDIMDFHQRKLSEDLGPNTVPLTVLGGRRRRPFLSTPIPPQQDSTEIPSNLQQPPIIPVPAPNVNTAPVPVHVSGEELNSIFQPMFADLAAKFTTSMTHSGDPDVLDKLDGLLSATQTHAAISEALLDRIAHAVENIKNVSGVGGETRSATRIVADGIAGTVWGGTRGLFNMNMKLRRRMKPVQRAILGLPMSVMRTVGPYIIPTASKAFGIAKSVAGFLGDHTWESMKKAPGRLKKHVGMMWDGASWVADQAATPAKKLADGALGVGKWLGKETLKGILKAPKVIARQLDYIGDLFIAGSNIPSLFTAKLQGGEYYDQRTGKRIKRVGQIRGTVVDRAGNIVLTANDFIRGLYARDGKKIKTGTPTPETESLKDQGLNFLASKIGYKRKPKSNVADPMEVLAEKDDRIIDVLTKIYSHLKKALVVEDSETQEANRTGGVNDLIRRRSAAKKAKTDAKTAGKVGAGGIAIPAAVGEQHAAEAPANDDGSTLTGAGIMAGVTGAMGTVAKYGGKIKNAISAARGVGAAATAAEVVTGTAAAAETAAVVGTGATVAAEGAVLGAGALGVGAMAAETAAAVALASNPIGWAILAGTALYGGYRAYKAIKTLRSLQPLELMRFLQYGIPVDNKTAVATIRYLEDAIKYDIKIDEKGAATIGITAMEVWRKVCDEFGGRDDNRIDFHNFYVWFYDRFFPVYAIHKVAAKAIAGLALEDVDDKLSAELKFKFVNSVQFGAKAVEQGVNPMSVTTSPWRDIALADNRHALDMLIKQITNLLKRGTDVSAKNLEKIVPIVPVLAPKKPSIVPPEPDYIAKNAKAEKAKLAGEDPNVGFFGKIAGTVGAGAGRIYDDMKAGAQATYAKGKEMFGQAGDYLSQHILQPAKNSFAAIIANAESKHAGYNDYNRGAGKKLGSNGPRNLVAMTIQQLLDASKLPISNPQRIFAMGKYQIVPDTLLEAAKHLKLDLATTLFDEKTQEYIFTHFLTTGKKGRGSLENYIKGKKGTLHGAALDTAMEWASIADPDKNGASHYPSTNKASVSSELIQSAIENARVLYAELRKKGAEEWDAYGKALRGGIDVGGDVLNKIGAGATDLINKTGLPNALSGLLAKTPLEGLRIKSQEAVAGGAALTGTTDLARLVQGQYGDEITHFSAFNDKYHQDHSPNSGHTKGLKFDVSLKQASHAAAMKQNIENLANSVGVPVKVLDEYADPSKKATGGHLDVGFKNKADADRFSALLKNPNDAVMPPAAESGSSIMRPVANPFAYAAQAAPTTVAEVTADTIAAGKPSTTMVSSPDLTFIAKTTEAVGSEAGKQRIQQLAETQKTNELLAQLINNMMSGPMVASAAKVSNSTLASNSLPQSPKTVKPVINLSRTM